MNSRSHKKDPAPWISPIDRENINEGKKHFQTASTFGLFTNSEALPKLAWFEYLGGDAERSVALLGEAAARQKGKGKALSLYYRGTILNRLGRYDQAQLNLDEALAERADLILARQEKGESLWQLVARRKPFRFGATPSSAIRKPAFGQQSTCRRRAIAS